MVIALDIVILVEKTPVDAHGALRESSCCFSRARAKPAALTGLARGRFDVRGDGIAARQEPASQVLDDIGCSLFQSHRSKDVPFHVDVSEEIELGEKLVHAEDFEEVPLGAAFGMVVPFAKDPLFLVEVSVAVVVDAQLQEQEDTPIGRKLGLGQALTAGLGKLLKGSSDGRR